MLYRHTPSRAIPLHGVKVNQIGLTNLRLRVDFAPASLYLLVRDSTSSHGLAQFQLVVAQYFISAPRSRRCKCLSTHPFADAQHERCAVSPHFFIRALVLRVR